MKKRVYVNHQNNDCSILRKQAKQRALLIWKRVLLFSSFIIFQISCTKTISPVNTVETKTITSSLMQQPIAAKCGYNLDEAALATSGWSNIFEENFGLLEIMKLPGAPATTLDQNKWTYWNSGALNEELQYYQLANLSFYNSDMLITAKKEHIDDRDTLPWDSTPRDFEYTSGRIESIQKFRGSDHLKTRLYARIKLPTAYGLWPAFWTLGVDVNSKVWPQTGEFDIMESKVNVMGKIPTKYQTNFIYGSNPYVPDNNAAVEIGNVDLTNCYHVFMVEWQQNELKFYYDDILKVTYTGGNIPKIWNKEHRIVLNLAYGGEFLGSGFSPNLIPAGTGTMYVDYVKVFVKN